MLVLALNQGIGPGVKYHAIAETLPWLTVPNLSESGAYLEEFVPPSSIIQEKSGSIVNAGAAPILIEEGFSIAWKIPYSISGVEFSDQNAGWKSSLVLLLYPTHEFS